MPDSDSEREVVGDTVGCDDGEAVCEPQDRDDDRLVESLRLSDSVEERVKDTDSVFVSESDDVAELLSL